MPPSRAAIIRIPPCPDLEDSSPLPSLLSAAILAVQRTCCVIDWDAELYESEVVREAM